MNNSAGALHFGAAIDLTQFRRDIASIRGDLAGLNQQTQTQTRGMDSAFRNLSIGIAGYFSGQALLGFVNKLIDVRGEMQKTEVAFATMLGNAGSAKALIGDMVELAAKTPFSLAEVSNGAKQLLAFQVPANEVLDTLTRMGNIAAGLGVPIGRLNLVYGQVRAKGRLMGDDLRQFTEAGIPIIAELAKKLGKADSEILKMVSDGKIGFKDVQDVLFNLTNEGGMFFNLMEKQSKTLSGQISNLGDNIYQMFNRIGEGSEGFLSDGISSLNFLVENYETFAEVIGVAIAAYGLYKAALIATAAWQQFSGTLVLQQALAQGTLTTAQAYGAAATVTLQRATVGLNAALLSNPIGLVIGLLAGLSYVIYKNVTATTAFTELQQKLKESTQQYSQSADEQRLKIETLTKIIKNKNTSEEEAASALKSINNITGNRIKGLTVEGIRIGENTAAIGKYIQMLELEARAKALIDIKLDADRRKKAILEDKTSTINTADLFGNVRKPSDIFVSDYKRKLNAQIQDLAAIEKVKKDADNEIASIQKQGVDVFNAKENAPVVNGRDVKDTTEKIKKTAKETARELAEVFSKNSIADLNQRISLYKEALEKAGGDEVDVLTKNKFGDTKKTGETISIKEAVARVEELEKAKKAKEKQIATRSFEENLAEMKRQISVRDKLLDAGYDENSVNNIFPDVVGKDYLQSLKDVQTELYAILQSGKGNEDTGNNLASINEQVRVLTGQKTRLEEFTKTFDDFKANLSSSEYLDKLQKARKIQAGDNTEEAGSVKLEIQKRIEAEIDANEKKYSELLKQEKSFQEKRTDLQREYDLIKNTDSYKNGSGQDQQKIDDSFAKNLSQITADQLKNSADYKVAFGDMEFYSSTALKRIEENLLKFKEANQEYLQPTELRELENALKRIQDAQSNNPFREVIGGFRDLIAAKDDVYFATERYNAAMANSEEGSKAQKIAADELTEAEKKQAEAKRQLVSGIGKAQNIFNAVGNGVKDLGDLFGGFDEATSDAINDILGIGNAAMDLGKSLASGDIAGAIKSGIELIGKVFAALNGDKKKERGIKEQAKAIKELEIAFDNLGFAAERAFGSMKYSGQRDLIANLEQQKAAIQQQLNLESSKKKADKGKIAEYQGQINSIGQSIAELKEGIIKDVLQTDIPDAAAKLGDALVDAFSRGEDGVKSLGDAANDMIKNLLKNQLNLALQDKLKPILDNLLQSSGFGADGSGTFTGLTPQQIADFKAQVTAAGTSMQGFLDTYSDIFGSLDSQASSLSGSIKGVSEETASVLAGQLNAIRINQGQSLKKQDFGLGIMANQLLQQVQIEQNTRPIKGLYDEMYDLNKRLKSKGF